MEKNEHLQELEKIYGDPATRTEKICSECKTKKPLGEYHKRKTSRDGRVSVCRTCAQFVGRENRVIANIKACK